MKDRLYQQKKEVIPPFEFNEEVTQVFEDMIQRSVPCYQDVLQGVISLIETKIKPQQTICDLGCSTGTVLIQIAKKLPQMQLRFVGYDNSSAMIEKAKANTQQAGVSIEYHCASLLDLSLPPASVFLLQYTLQFIPPEARLALLKNIQKQLLPGGFFILSEKICFANTVVDTLFREQYYDFKKRNGYSELEIAQKREALERVLVPMTFSQNISLLQQAGFQTIEPFFQWFNFVSYFCLAE